MVNLLEDYFLNLRSTSSRCECPEVKGVYTLRDRYIKTQALADFFKGNVDLENVNPEDERFLRDYLRAVDVMEAVGNRYMGSLRKSIESGILRLNGHDVVGGEVVVFPVTIDEIVNSNNPKTPITASCKRCDTHIDFIELNK